MEPQAEQSSFTAAASTENLATKVTSEVEDDCSGRGNESEPTLPSTKKRKPLPSDANEIKKTKQKRAKRHNIANTTSLGSSSVLKDDDDQFNISEIPSAIETTRRNEAIVELLKGVSERDVTIEQLKSACQSFATGRAIRPSVTDGKRTWSLEGMISSLWTHQLLAVAQMRKFEGRKLGLFGGRKTGPFGGVLGDEIGFGKTVMMLANIVDARNAKGAKKQRTLIVVPSGIISQWFLQIKLHCTEKATGKVLKYFGAAKNCDEDKIKMFKRHRIVLTTHYELMSSLSDLEPPDVEDSPEGWAELAAFETKLEKASGPLLQFEWDRVVLDEAQEFKNHLTRRSRAARLLKATYRWAMSGTPLQNSAKELYAYFDFLKVPGTTSMRAFTAKYFEDSNEFDSLGAALSDFLIRRTHDSKLFGEPIVRLPRKTITTRWIEFSPTERWLYQKVERKVKSQIALILRSADQDPDKETPASNRARVLRLLLRLRQLVSHYLLLTPQLPRLLDHDQLKCLIRESNPRHGPLSDKVIGSICAHIYKCAAYYEKMKKLQKKSRSRPITKHTKKKIQKLAKKSAFNVETWTDKHQLPLLTSAKTRACMAQIGSWIAEDPRRKIIVFSQFVAVVEALQVHCREGGYGNELYYGKMGHKAREAAKERWQCEEHVPVLLMTLQSGGVGLNLIAGSLVLNVDLWFNQGAEMQAFGRVFRIGQKSETEMVRLAVRKTIDQRLLEIQHSKQTEIDSVMTRAKKAGPSFEELVSVVGDLSELSTEAIAESEGEASCNIDDSLSDDDSDDSDDSDSSMDSSNSGTSNNSSHFDGEDDLDGWDSDLEDNVYTGHKDSEDQQPPENATRNAEVDEDYFAAEAQIKYLDKVAQVTPGNVDTEHQQHRGAWQYVEDCEE
ncbi:MAG: hypothetical protein M1828_003265 [Chrysothrix sp. TS-e1954]|nr:MAG: hypothetical protein M1828_003265 [Chrysothrix sp. TS-e1954]